MIKIKLECWWTDTGNLQRRFINQFVPKNDLEHFSFVTENPDYTIIFGRTDWEKITTPKDRTFYFSQEPLWSPNEPKTDISDYCSKIFVADKLMYPDKDEYIEGLFPMFYGGRGDEHNDVEYCWDLRLKDYECEKTKNVSLILSAKQTTIGHRLRHVVNKTYPHIDSYGYNNPIENKITALKDYRFSVVIENCQKDYYFSEKLIDSFITGTIPIYWGCPSISHFFDTNGMLIFNTLNELELIINNLNEGLYNSKFESIKHNFEEAKKYLVADNLIYEKLKNA